MKLLVKNIARIEYAEISIDGISVLAGFNATGKSTISRSLNGIIRAYQDLRQRAERSKRRSIDQAIENFLEEVGAYVETYDLTLSQAHDALVDDLISGKAKLPEHYLQFSELYAAYVKIHRGSLEGDPNTEGSYQKFRMLGQKIIDRPIQEDMRFLVQGRIREAFDSQINALGRSSIGRIELQNDNEAVICAASFQEDKVVECTYETIKENAPIYLEPRHVLDDLYTSKRYWFQIKRAPILTCLEADAGRPEESRTLEAQEIADRVTAMIDKAIQGGLVKSDNALQYVDECIHMPISIKNVASGSKTFAVIKRLVENGQFYHNHTLIIDEPEVNLHPAWQITLAEVLVILHRELGLKVFLNTHSPYFVRAMETFSARYDIAGRCHFYRTEEGESGLYRVEDVTEETEKIFRDLYLPLEEI